MFDIFKAQDIHAIKIGDPDEMERVLSKVTFKNERKDAKNLRADCGPIRPYWYLIDFIEICARTLNVYYFGYNKGAKQYWIIRKHCQACANQKNFWRSKTNSSI
jgi:hypothetical protein